MIQYKTEMSRCTETQLVLHFTQEQGTSVRHATVSIPLRSLVLSASFNAALERAARRALIEQWSDELIDDVPLF